MVCGDTERERGGAVYSDITHAVHRMTNLLCVAQLRIINFEQFARYTQGTRRSK